LYQTKPGFDENMVTIVCPKFRPQIATIRAGVFDRKKFDSQRGDIKILRPKKASQDELVRIIKKVKKENSSVRLEDAPIVIGAGRGLRDSNSLTYLKRLANILGGEIGATKAIVDLGWIDKDYMIGQTGKTIKPRLYIACGISGAIQHIVGIRKAKFIVAINKDPYAPIFKIADLCLIGDVNRIIPEVLTQLELED